MSFEIAFRLKGAFHEDKEIGAWVAFCRSLQVYSQGETQDEAKEALVDAAHSFILTCLEHQNLETALTSRGMFPESAAAGEKMAAQEQEEWITVTERFDEGEFDFDVNVPFHPALAKAAA